MTNDKLDERTIELARFADPGAAPLSVKPSGPKAVVSMVRNGQSLKIEFRSDSDAVKVSFDKRTRNFDSYKAMLASDLFANLTLWATRQADVLSKKFDDLPPQIPPHGTFQPAGSAVDSFLDVAAEMDRLANSVVGVRVCLIDGPAGVGKTNLVERLALAASQNFSLKSNRLVLHVQSRGKILSNIDDLMALSLQRLRLSVTYDQIPVLVRHGLVALAIDGFDELGDPEGYGYAWGQLNDLIDYVRGDGFLILAGRETFIGRDRLIRSVPGLGNDASVVELVLEETPPHVAKVWMEAQDISPTAIETIDETGLLDRGSFALRPFFLAYLAKELKADGAWAEQYSQLSDILPIVVNRMIDREVRRFRGEVADSIGEGAVRDFILRFLSEVAREMAGDQSESIADTMLSWLVEVAAPTDASPAVIGVLKARAPAMAFLALDDRPGYRTFGHSQFFNYFLARSTLDSLSVGDIPKWLRRGAVGADFLAAFVPFVRAEHAVSAQSLSSFNANVRSLMDLHGSSGEGPSLGRNVCALAFAMFAISSESLAVEVRGSEIQHAYAGSGTFFGVLSVSFVHSMDARGCDLSGVLFDSAAVNTLFVDKGSLFGDSLPAVFAIRFQSEDGGVSDVFEPAKVQETLLQLTARGHLEGTNAKSDSLALLDKLCRSRRYWFKFERDDLFGNLSEQVGWDELISELEANELLRIDEKRQVSGANARWFHIKNSKSILLRDVTDPHVKQLLENLGAAW